ncbi:MAG: DUF1629 domain-containing protein [Actinomycetota bacterium]
MTAHTTQPIVQVIGGDEMLTTGIPMADLPEPLWTQLIRPTPIRTDPDRWVTPQVITLQAGEVPVDFPELVGGLLVCRTEVRTLVESLDGIGGTFLPLDRLDGPDGDWWLYEPPVVADGLDLANSDVDVDDEVGIGAVRHLAFHRAAIGGLPLFAVPEMAATVFAQVPFVELVGAHGLTGLEFLQIEAART